jgi:hypothetical protein
MNDPDSEAARAFVEEAQLAFRFLQDDLGYAETIVEDVPFAVWVTAKRPETGVKVALDVRDRLVEVFLVRLVDGELPPYDEAEATHYADTISLATLVRGEPNPTDYQLASFARQELQRVLQWNAGVVREFVDILRGDFRRFEEAIAARRVTIARLDEQLQRESQDAEGLRGLGRLLRLGRSRRSD